MDFCDNIFYNLDQMDKFLNRCKLLEEWTNQIEITYVFLIKT